VFFVVRGVFSRPIVFVFLILFDIPYCYFFIEVRVCCFGIIFRTSRVFHEFSLSVSLDELVCV
jgi:hypothetical protein